MTSTLNPFDLLGVSIHSSPDEVKQSYYNLALLCHPDRGGNHQDMVTLHKAFLYVKQQIQASQENDKTNKSMEQLEQDFQHLYQQKDPHIPSFCDIYQNYHIFQKKFNQEFELKHKSENLFGEGVDPFLAGGYGHFMENSTPDEEEEQTADKPLRRPFSGAPVIIYREPESLPNQYGAFQHCQSQPVDDFSHSLKGKLEMTDYKIAHTPLSELAPVSRDTESAVEQLEIDYQNQRDQEDELITKTNDQYWQQQSSSKIAYLQNLLEKEKQD